MRRSLQLHQVAKSGALHVRHLSQPESFSFFRRSVYFKMFYLLNRASKSRTAFAVGFLASRSSKLDSILIGFDKKNFTKKKPDEKTRMKKPNRKHGFSLSERGTPVPLTKSQPCLSRKQNRDIAKERKKRNRIFF